MLIVLWNAIILHARWGGLIKERGLMAMAVFGNIVTSFSWFGVNMLGIGLHSYGFMDTGLFLADAVRRQPGRADCPGADSAQVLGQLQAARRPRFRTRPRLVLIV